MKPSEKIRSAMVIDSDDNKALDALCEVVDSLDTRIAALEPASADRSVLDYCPWCQTNVPKVNGLADTTHTLKCPAHPMRATEEQLRAAITRAENAERELAALKAQGAGGEWVWRDKDGDLWTFTPEGGPLSRKIGDGDYIVDCGALFDTGSEYYDRLALTVKCLEAKKGN